MPLPGMSLPQTRNIVTKNYFTFGKDGKSEPFQLVTTGSHVTSSTRREIVPFYLWERA